MSLSFITSGDRWSNTRSDKAFLHASVMSMTHAESAYWKRLKQLPSFQPLASQVAVAKMVTKITGVKYGQTGVQKWKATSAQPPIEVSRLLATHDGFSAEWLISGQGDPKPALIPEDWPFKTISPSRYWALSEGQRIAIEGRLLGEIVDIENAKKKR